MTLIPADFNWEAPDFIAWRSELRQDYQPLMYPKTASELASLSDNELARRDLLFGQYMRQQPKRQQREESEPEDEMRRRVTLDITDNYNFRTPRDTEEILVYDNGVFREGGESLIKELVREYAGSDVSKAFVREIVESIRDTTHIDRADFDADPNILNLKNGLLNVVTGELKDHTPEYPSLIQLPIEYKPKATCRDVIEFLYDIVLDPAYVPVLLEYVAYCLQSHKRLQKELLLVGAPDSGKSVFLFFLTALFGTQNVSNVTMQQLSTNRFATAQLEGKLINIYADISHARLEDIERFKAIATADEIEVERKGMQLHKMKPRGKLAFSANVPPKPPITVDDSFYRRWLIMQCALRERHYFSGKPIVKNPNLLAKLTTPENLSGFFNLVLVSLRRLLKTQRFCKDISTDQTRELYDRLSNPVRMWVEQCLVEEEGADLEKSAGYQSYVRFCKERKMGVYNDAWLGKELAALGFLEAKKGNSRKVQVKVWAGLRLKETGLGNPTSVPVSEKQVDSVQRTEVPLPSPAIEEQQVSEAEHPLPSPSEEQGTNQPETVIPCPYCDIAYPTEQQVIDHSVVAHPRRAITAELENRRNGIVLVHTPEPETETASKHSLAEPEKAKSNEHLKVDRIIWCEWGDKAFPTEDQLTQHLIEHHMHGPPKSLYLNHLERSKLTISRRIAN